MIWLSWRLKELIYLRCLEHCLTYIKCYINVNFINYAYETDKQRAQKQALVEKKIIWKGTEISQDFFTLYKRSCLLKREPNQRVEKGRLHIRTKIQYNNPLIGI